MHALKKVPAAEAAREPQVENHVKVAAADLHEFAEISISAPAPLL